MTTALVLAHSGMHSSSRPLEAHNMQRTTHTNNVCLQQVVEAAFQRLLLRTHVQQIVDRLRAVELPNIVSHPARTQHGTPQPAARPSMGHEARHIPGSNGRKA